MFSVSWRAMRVCLFLTSATWRLYRQVALVSVTQWSSGHLSLWHSVTPDVSWISVRLHLKASALSWTVKRPGRLWGQTGSSELPNHLSRRASQDKPPKCWWGKLSPFLYQSQTESFCCFHYSVLLLIRCWRAQGGVKDTLWRPAACKDKTRRNHKDQRHPRRRWMAPAPLQDAQWHIQGSCSILTLYQQHALCSVETCLL